MLPIAVSKELVMACLVFPEVVNKKTAKLILQCLSK